MAGLRWVRLDATFPGNPKVVDLAGRGHHRAITVYVCSLAYAGHQGTDGHIPQAALPFIHATRTHAKQLCEAGLWIANGDGWNIHDWHDYQPRSEASADRSRSAREAANIRWHGTPNP